jgi:O-antigen biosynthesis protein WbqP
MKIPLLSSQSFLRLCDILFSFFGLALLFPILLMIFAISLFDTGSPLFFQKRLGYKRKMFNLVKFRTMSVNTPSVASHMVDPKMITPFGTLLRKTKLDELPQLWNVLLGDMSLVGPRPNLPDQLELIDEREKRGVFDVKPGVTGLAQVNNVDMSAPKELAIMDAEMINNFRTIDYFKYIFITVMGKGRGDAAGNK